jgi:hypothetical protein
VGFVPSHTSADGALVTPIEGGFIHHYGGWWLGVMPLVSLEFDAGVIAHGWTPLPPRATAAGDAATVDASAYATTDLIPPVPAGSAIELAVYYAAGTCRVAFYTPETVSGGFVELPYAKLELRFAATAAENVPEWGDIPARGCRQPTRMHACSCTRP